MAFLQIPFRTFASGFRCRAFLWRGKIHARPPGFRESNSDRLLWGSRSMLTLPNVLHLLAYEFACLRGWSFPFRLIPLRPLNRFLFWHVRLQRIEPFAR
jgi:hypothetical protein